MGGKTKEHRVVNDRLARVAELLCKGLSKNRISRELKVSNATVCRDVEFLEEEWRQRFARDIEVHKARMLMELAYVRSQAWAEWERSKRDAETVVEKMEKEENDSPPDPLDGDDSQQSNPLSDLLGDSLESSEQDAPDDRRAKWRKNAQIRARAKKHGLKPFSLTRTLKGQSGDPAYLKIIVDTLAKESDVLGLTVHKIAPVDPSGTTAYGEHMMNEMMKMSESLQRGPLVTTDDVIEANVVGHIESKPANISDSSHGQGDESPALNEGELSNIFGGLLGGLDGSEGDTDVSGEVEEKAKK